MWLIQIKAKGSGASLCSNNAVTASVAGVMYAWMAL